ncbi:protein rep [Ectobacillus funiculus]|uniref:Protein rep n=1 Tax=Ectobacillus funiculus TaxID=137993 RepID=A0ABV5WAD3_9BACI
MKIERQFLEKIVKNREYNEIFQAYYEKLHGETKDDKLERKRDHLKDCNALWFIDRYEIARVKDFQKTNLCKDKFCNNCKKVKQAARMSKFIPLIRPYSRSMYQLTLTVPNVRGEQLGETIDDLFKAFSMLINYLKGKKKIKGVDFERFKYEGAIRSLEVTYKGNEYHPHLHALVVLHINPLDDAMIRRHKNVYSKDFKGNREDRLFSDAEVLIQKVWYLLINKQRVFKRAIDELDKGYSCQLDKFKESDFIELFKYMTKATNEDDATMNYRQFKTLYYALLNRRQIQGYGCFFNLKDEEVSMEEVNELYDAIIEELKQKESPLSVSETPNELMQDTEYTLISRKRIYAYLKQLRD